MNRPLGETLVKNYKKEIILQTAAMDLKRLREFSQKFNLYKTVENVNTFLQKEDSEELNLHDAINQITSVSDELFKTFEIHEKELEREQNRLNKESEDIKSKILMLNKRKSETDATIKLAEKYASYTGLEQELTTTASQLIKAENVTRHDFNKNSRLFQENLSKKISVAVSERCAEFPEEVNKKILKGWEMMRSFSDELFDQLTFHFSDIEISSEDLYQIHKSVNQIFESVNKSYDAFYMQKSDIPSFSFEDYDFNVFIGAGELKEGYDTRRMIMIPLLMISLYPGSQAIMAFASGRTRLMWAKIATIVIMFLVGDFIKDLTAKPLNAITERIFNLIKKARIHDDYTIYIFKNRYNIKINEKIKAKMKSAKINLQIDAYAAEVFKPLENIRNQVMTEVTMLTDIFQNNLTKMHKKRKAETDFRIHELHQAKAETQRVRDRVQKIAENLNTEDVI